ncbi:hypothetical protein PVK06_029644 [Gossypium arboreum]|uniref:Aminotransferase-like plant mobile domain-containing protein n=1 Tax=Gossypium arboreum TaxID=29729 RepID=A0ABR0NL41_GOSAR|nr:hypothetical protein PVK06_029644 [Gossypium arboreum]
MDTVSLSIFTSSSGPPIYIPTHNEFQWTLYEDSTIRAVIPDEYLQNLNAWHVKVPLVNFAIVEMHQLDRVLRQFGFRKPIPVAPDVLDDHHRMTYGNCIRIGRDSGHTLSKYGKIGWNAWPGSSSFSIILSGPPIYRPPSYSRSHEGPSGSSSFYQSPSPYRFQTPSPLMMQTPPQSLFSQGGSSSQHPQPDPLLEEPKSLPEQPQPALKARQKRNPVHNRRRPLCGTESDRHGH